MRYAKITDDSGIGIQITAVEKSFGLNVNHYTEKTLTSWKHIVDYRDENATIVNIDGFMRGSGSGSCGPGPEKHYQIPEGTLRFAFLLTPIFGSEESNVPTNK